MLFQRTTLVGKRKFTIFKMGKWLFIKTAAHHLLMDDTLWLVVSVMMFINTGRDCSQGQDVMCRPALPRHYPRIYLSVTLTRVRRYSVLSEFKQTSIKLLPTYKTKQMWNVQQETYYLAETLSLYKHSNLGRSQSDISRWNTQQMVTATSWARYS